MKKHYLSLEPFVHWQQTELPINWAKWFRREAPLDIEIGFGSGEFLIRQAQTGPGRNFAGIEVGWGSVRRALRKINKEGLRNIRLLLVDTRVAFEYLIAPASVHRVYSLFPMPWPKDKHIKHRVFSNAFLRLLNSRLVPQGEVRIVTDFEPYAAWIYEQLPGTGFALEAKSTRPLFNTKYERKWRAQGQERFFEIHLVKKEGLAFKNKEVQPVKIYCVEHFDPERFSPLAERGEVVVDFKDYLYDPKRQKAMARAVVVEDTLLQEVWIEIDHAEQGWYIHVAPGCGALPTVGVQRAVDLVHEAVLATRE